VGSVKAKTAARRRFFSIDLGHLVLIGTYDEAVDALAVIRERPPNSGIAFSTEDEARYADEAREATVVEKAVRKAIDDAKIKAVVGEGDLLAARAVSVGEVARIMRRIDARGKGSRPVSTRGWIEMVARELGHRIMKKP